MTDRNILANLTRVTSTDERQIMYKAMIGLRPIDRQTVVLFAVDGKVHTNRPDLLAQLHPQLVPFIHGLDSELSSLTTAAGSTGPYFRRDGKLGYPFGQINIRVPCVDVNFTQNEFGYFYLGGTTYSSSKPNKQGVLPAIDEVDAGMQIGPKPNIPPSPAPAASLQVYISDAWMGKTGIVTPISVGHMACDNTIFTMTFYPASSTELAISIAGNTHDGTSPLALAEQVNDTGTKAPSGNGFNPLGTGAGWSSTCSLCLVKRVISIANPNEPDGSILGIDASPSPAQPTVQISNAVIGTLPGDQPLPPASPSPASTIPWPQDTSFPYQSRGFQGSELCVQAGTQGDTLGIDELNPRPSCPFNT